MFTFLYTPPDSAWENMSSSNSEFYDISDLGRGMLSTERHSKVNNFAMISKCHLEI